MEFHLGVLDLDLALVSDKPVGLTESSSKFTAITVPSSATPAAATVASTKDANPVHASHETKKNGRKPKRVQSKHRLRLMSLQVLLRLKRREKTLIGVTSIKRRDTIRKTVINAGHGLKRKV